MAMGRIALSSLPGWIFSLFLLFPRTACGQILKLSSASARPGDWVSIEISINLPAGKEPPSALQWETVIPTAQLSFLEEGTRAGPAAQTAGKSVSCSVKTQAETNTSVCVLFGGQEPIRNGVVAILRLAVSAQAKTGNARVRLEHALAVSKNLARVELAPSETRVRIRTK